MRTSNSKQKSKVAANFLMHQTNSLQNNKKCTESLSHSSHSDFESERNEIQSYLTKWNNYVSNDGSLFYAEYSKQNVNHLKNISAVKPDSSSLINATQKRTKIEHNFTRDNLSKSLNEQENKQNENLLTLPEIEEFKILINPSNKIELRSKLTLIEFLFGFSTCAFSDGVRLVVSGYNSSTKQEKRVKIGYWFKSVNEFEVNVQNINEILLKFTKPSTVILKFQNIQGERTILENCNFMQITSFEHFSNYAHNLLQDNSFHSTVSLINEQYFSLILLPTPSGDYLTASTYPLFCYPNKEINNLFSAKGCFLTLHSILSTELKTEPVQTHFYIKDIEYTVCYFFEKNYLLLIAIQSNISTENEIHLHSLKILNYIKTNYEISQSKINISMENHLYYSCKIIEVLLLKEKGFYLIEQIIEESRRICLPKDALLRTYDVLNELEAMDYKDWNEQPLSSHREYFINESALYYESYLIANKMEVSHLKQLESILQYAGIFNFIQNQNVKDFVYWRKIHMSNLTGRYFLAICSRNQLTLAVILEAFKFEESKICDENIIYPSLFYIEEIQDTLEYLYRSGIETIANICSIYNNRPEVIETTYSNLATKKAKASVKRIVKSQPTLAQSEQSNKGDSDSDWDGFPISCKSVYDVSDSDVSLVKSIPDALPISITAGKENELIYFMHVDFGLSIIISPTKKSNDFLVEEFKSACYKIHENFQNINLNNNEIDHNCHGLQDCKHLNHVKEYGILMSVSIANSSKINLWAIGRQFEFPKRELYICHKSGISQNLVEMAFRFAFLNIE